MSSQEQTLIFGPVPSRRLGRSLGVDLVPFKTCTYNCIYCQLGRTTNLTIERKQYVPISDVMEQLRRRLDDAARPDYITLSGSGEPSLHSGISELISSVKKQTNIPVAVLTNGSLLWDKEVQEALLGADLVVPSLDAGNPEVFMQVNRPHPELGFIRIVEGLIEFRGIYKGEIWLEIFLLDGINSMPSEVLRIKKLADAIRPDRIQLNTVVRPAAEDYVLRVPGADMNEIKNIFGKHAEVIVPYEQAPLTHERKAVADEVLVMLRRRPCTLDDIASGLSIHRNEAIKHLAKLEEKNLALEVRKDGVIYYQAATIAISDNEPRSKSDYGEQNDI